MCLVSAKVSNNTVLCSRHFYNGKRTAAQPHPVKFEHKTYPLCRKVPLKRSNPEPVSEAEPPAKKVGECHTLPSLSSLCTAALKKFHGTLLGHISQRKPSVFTSHQWKHDDSKFSFYTGLPAYDIFLYIMEYLQPHLSSLYIRHCPKEVGENPPNKLGRRRSLTIANEFYMTLVFLRHGLKEEMLADLFGLSNKSQVSYILQTWIPFLAVTLRPLLVWPDRRIVFRKHPETFRSDPDCRNCRIIIDCFEVRTEKPKSLSVNNLSYSDYKGCNTFKVLVGVTPTGYVSFVSKAYPGSISDPATTRQSGLLDKLEPGDCIMADKGFPLTGQDLQPRGLSLTLTPFKRGEQQMSAADDAKNRRIANRRIIVENAICRLKVFAILSKKFSLKFAHSQLVSDIVEVIAILSNFGIPLR